MVENIKKIIKLNLEDYYKKTYKVSLDIIVEEPKNATLGDISVPLFSVVKTLKKPMPQLVEEASNIIKNFDNNIISTTKAGAFINIMINKVKVSENILKEILLKKETYGQSNLGKDKNVVLDYSSPNIAKSFSVGHLRSTMIGNSIKLILKKASYNTTSINYLGDWGTQFGKMIIAYELWGSEEEIKKDSIAALTKLYVKFNEEASKDESLNDQARKAFRKIELGDEKYLKLWQWIKDESLKESQQIYDLLDITFDSYNGEAYYNDKMDDVVKELEDKKILEKSDGAMIVALENDLPPALIKRKDGGSLYITRDLAAVFDRKREYEFDKCLYVVGNEQKLHFTQLSKVLDKMRYDFASDLIHVNFGLYLTNGKKMSTRQGNVVKLYDVLEQAISLALEQINEKNPHLENKEIVAKKIGTAAIVFADLKNHRTLDIEFDLSQSVRFEGQTGPYLQYTGVRISSILKDVNFNQDKVDYSVFEKPHYFELSKLLDQFQVVIEKSALEYAPSILAKYLLSLAQSFNKFYSLEKINHENETLRNANLILAYSVKTVINEGLRLLGIKSVEQM